MHKVKEHKPARHRFSTNLAGHIASCEKNYHRLMQLLPGLRDGAKQWRFQLGDTANIAVVIQTTDQAPYTSEVAILQSREGIDLPELKLRLYHDACVAEVIAFAGHRNWQSKYDYPNPKMYQPDEKFALNRFLDDWLVFCRKHGLVALDTVNQFS